jgi:hypothetical protein
MTCSTSYAVPPPPPCWPAFSPPYPSTPRCWSYSAPCASSLSGWHDWYAVPEWDTPTSHRPTIVCASCNLIIAACPDCGGRGWQKGRWTGEVRGCWCSRGRYSPTTFQLIEENRRVRGIARRAVLSLPR